MMQTFLFQEVESKNLEVLPNKKENNIKNNTSITTTTSSTTSQHNNISCDVAQTNSFQQQFPTLPTTSNSFLAPYNFTPLVTNNNCNPAVVTSNVTTNKRRKKVDGGTVVKVKSRPVKARKRQVKLTAANYQTVSLVNG